MRVAIGGISHETSTFAVGTTTLKHFEADCLHFGQDIVETNRGIRSFIGGMIAAADEQGIEVTGTFVAGAEPSGLIERQTYEHLRHELLKALEEAEPLDAVCLSLHGAGLADGYDDLEGDLLTHVRRLVGPTTPIVGTLDLHANVTTTMVEQADALLGNHLYPHSDSYERGHQAVQLASKMVREGLRPTSHVVHIPMLTATAPTSLSPGKEVNELCFDWEAKSGVVDVTFYHGFPFTDIPRMGMAVVATTNDDPELARRAAESVARAIWTMRDAFRPVITSPEEAIRLALATDARPIVVNDHSDNPGAGAPGDSTHLLRPFIEAGIPDSVFGWVVDPEIARQAHAAGVGSTIQVRLGGKTDTFHGSPIEAKAYVKCLTDGRFTTTSPMGQGGQNDLGKMARLVINGVDVLISSVRTQVLDPEAFLLHGIDVSRYKLVGVKSATHFRAGFEPVAAQIIRVDTPGLSSTDLSSFAYQRLELPIWPLDEATVFPLAGQG
jgi:microcystin degradation protein MlrC